MHPTIRVLSERVHTPLIRFLGRRSWPSHSEAPHAHPSAPAEFQSKNYASFSKEDSSAGGSSSPSSGSNVFREFWEAPEKFWKPRVHELDEAEIDAIQSGGASLR